MRRASRPVKGAGVCRAGVVILAAALGLAMTDSASAQAPKGQLKAVELAIEASAESVLLPSDAPGNLIVTACAKCNPVSLLATSRSQYFIGRSQVQLADLRREMAARPGATVVVFYDGKTRELTRVVASGRP
jgi:hypothetical protein